MKREELAHLLRAAAEITGDHDILVIGSQAVLASYPDSALPERATMSVEADIAFLDDPSNEKSDTVEGALGEDSLFHQAHGYYAQGVGLDTATLPYGWTDRAIRFTHGDVGDAEALCLEVHDLILSKLFAGRPKDLEYATALWEAGILTRATLLERVDSMPAPPAARRRITAAIERLRDR